jgi:uncharacterized membrane protein
VRRYFITGILVWLPLAVTIWVLHSALGVLDAVFASVLKAVSVVAPAQAAPVLQWLSTTPGVGVVVMLLALLLTGMLVSNMAGQWVARQSDRLLSHIPIVKSIYTSVKQVSDTLFSSSGQAFREAVLVQYPRAGVWTIAFVTGHAGGEVREHLGDDVLSLYVPTTPNPTSGFMLLVPRSEVHTLQMSVDEALKYIISMGVVAPPARGDVEALAPLGPDVGPVG